MDQPEHGVSDPRRHASHDEKFLTLQSTGESKPNIPYRIGITISAGNKENIRPT